MHSALAEFNGSMRAVREQGALYDYLISHVQSPFVYDDILKFQIVFAVSAFDKLIHDLVRIGMVAMYTGARPSTPKYANEAISIQVHKDLLGATLPPAESLFEQEVARKLRTNSFQHPDKVADALSYIWPQTNKWFYISQNMGWSQQDATTKLRLITTRRNAIVHEADMDPVTNTRHTISKQETEEVLDFLQACGNSVVALVA